MITHTVKLSDLFERIAVLELRTAAQTIETSISDLIDAKTAITDYIKELDER